MWVAVLTIDDRPGSYFDRACAEVVALGRGCELVHSFFIFNTENERGPRRATEDVGMLEHRGLTERIIGLAIEVHRQTGPGLLVSVYAACLAFELEQAGIPLLRQVGVPVFYKGTQLPLGFRADILVADTVILEIKAVPALLPAHEAQLQTYLRMSGMAVGLLMNFHATRLKDGLRRFVGSPGAISSVALRGPHAASVFEMEEE